MPSSDANSLNTCLHAPQGVQFSIFGENTATALSFLSPFAIALPTAFLSAQIVNPKLEFSKLQPEYVFPLSAKIHAPTGNFE